MSKIATLDNELTALHLNLSAWVMDISMRVSKQQSDNLNQTPSGDENFVERMALRVSRNAALISYDNLCREIQRKIASVNDSGVIKRINELLDDEGYDEFELYFEPDEAPERNTSLDEEDWNDDMHTALGELRDGTEGLLDQLMALGKKLQTLGA